jgi:hypothetical protein
VLIGASAAPDAEMRGGNSIGNWVAQKTVFFQFKTFKIALHAGEHVRACGVFMWGKGERGQGARRRSPFPIAKCGLERSGVAGRG